MPRLKRFNKKAGPIMIGSRPPSKYYHPSTKSVFKRNFSNFYSLNVDPNLKIEGGYKVINKLIKDIIGEVAYHIVNNPSGVLLQSIGYFYVHSIVGKRRIWGPKKMSKHRIAFIPTKFSVFTSFTFDYRYSTRLKNAVKERIKKGARYLNFSHMINKNLEI